VAAPDGALTRRGEILALLLNLPHAPVVDCDEVLLFIGAHALMGSAVWGLAHAARRLGVAA
jgi:hypothetical protein